MRVVGFLVITLLSLAPLNAAEPDKFKPVTGDVDFVPKGADGTPEVFRMLKHSFPYEMTLKYDLKHSEIEIYHLTFPSPVKTEFKENNTVHAMYFRPKKPGKYPGVLALDILDGKQVVARSQALWLAQNDVATLVVYMAHYGPRRAPGSKERLLTTDVAKSVANVTQTVLDCRRAIAWLEARPEIDGKKLSVLGTSLGSFVGGVVAAAEPKIASACLCLGGGALVESFADHPMVAWLTPILQIAGVSTDRLKKLIDPVDPITYADILKKKRLFLFAASRDDVVPPIAMKRLWEATDKPEMVWVDSTHVGAMYYSFQMMRGVTKHVKE